MARNARLKVFRTPIGFHDAYVAAPSRKAALAAWGSDVDLFARGSAEVVTDEELIREPLAKPGQVIKRLRGSADEHLAALPPDPARTETHPAAEEAPSARRHRSPARKPLDRATRTRQPPPPPPPPPRPSRAALDAAERDLDALIERQKREDDELREREKRLAQERDQLARAHGRERAAAEHEVESERSRHARALARWSDERAAGS